jgi:hypothetical protein
MATIKNRKLVLKRPTISYKGPSKTDSAPVCGDGQDLVVVVGVEGGSEKFSDGEILKTTTVGSLHMTTITLFSYLGHLYNPTWIYSTQ